MTQLKNRRAKKNILIHTRKRNGIGWGFVPLDHEEGGLPHPQFGFPTALSQTLNFMICRNFQTIITQSFKIYEKISKD